MTDVSRRKSDLLGDPVQRALFRRVMLYSLMYLCLSVAVGIVLQIFSDPMKAFTLSWTVLLKGQLASLAAAVVLLPIFLRDMAKLSVRFLGPVLRLQGAIRGVVNGDEYRPVKFRENDYWQNLADDFNQLMEERVVKREDPTTSVEGKAAECSESLSA